MKKGKKKPVNQRQLNAREKRKRITAESNRRRGAKNTTNDLPQRFLFSPLFDKEGLGEILLDKSLSVPFFQRGRLIFTCNVI